MPRRSCAGSRAAVSCPSIVIRPEVGSIIRLTIRNEVVLPQPDGPTSTVVAPLGAVRSRPSTATVPSAYALLTPSKRIIEGSQSHRGGRSPASPLGSSQTRSLLTGDAAATGHSKFRQNDPSSAQGDLPIG